MDDPKDRFRRYLRSRLVETQVSMRKLSQVMGKDSSYVREFLDPPPNRPRALPTPKELQLAVPLLGVPLMELFEEAYGIGWADLGAGLSQLDGQTDQLRDGWLRLTSREREEVLLFIDFVRDRRDRLFQPSGSDATES